MRRGTQRSFLSTGKISTSEDLARSKCSGRLASVSKGYVNAVVDFQVPFSSDLEKTFRAMAEAGRRLRLAQREVLAETQIQGLVELGTSIEIENQHKQRPLHKAAASGSLRVAKWLIEDKGHHRLIIENPGVVTAGQQRVATPTNPTPRSWMSPCGPTASTAGSPPTPSPTRFRTRPEALFVVK